MLLEVAKLPVIQVVPTIKKHPGRIAFLDFNRVGLFPYRVIHPECLFFFGDNRNMVPLQCLPFREKRRVFKVDGRNCHVGIRCMERLRARLGALFEQATPTSQLIVLYFQERDTQRLLAGVFRRDYQAPYVTALNPYAWNYIRERSVTCTWEPPESFWLL